jgi:hypothetical protein
MLSKYESKIIEALAFERTCFEVHNVFELAWRAKNPNKSFWHYLFFGPSFARTYNNIMALERKGYIICVGKRRHSKARIFRRTGKRTPGKENRISGIAAPQH